LCGYAANYKAWILNFSQEIFLLRNNHVYQLEEGLVSVYFTYTVESRLLLLEVEDFFNVEVSQLFKEMSENTTILKCRNA